jgi:opacity protein-like surface antigen
MPVRFKIYLCRLFLASLIGFVLFGRSPASLAEDTNTFRPYLQLRSAAFNEYWGVQDGWGIGLGANVTKYLGFQLDFDAFERKVDWPGLDTIFENSVMTLTPEIRVRYPLGSGRWVPYAFAGPGVTFFQFNDRKNPAFHREVHGDSTQFSAVFGAGIEYYVADNISFNIEGKYDWIGSDPVTVDGQRRNIDYSSALLMFGVRAYFGENHHRELLEQKEAETTSRFWGGFRYGSSILLDNRVNGDLRFEPVAASLGGTGNQAAGFLLGYNLGPHWGFGLSLNGTEYNLASDQFGVVGEYAIFCIIPEVRWHWTFLDGRLAPFVSGGFGATYAEFNDRKPPGENLKIDSRGVYPSVDIGAGLEYFFVRNISIAAESHYITSWNHEIPINGHDAGRGSFSALNLLLGLRFYIWEH